MTYLKRSNVSGKRSQMTTALIVAALLALFGVHYFFPTALPRVFLPVTSIFWQSESSTIGWFASMGKIVTSKYSLIKENKRLKNEIVSRDSSALMLSSLIEENENLKSALGRSATGDDILGVILSRPPMSPYDTLIIDIGTADGVAVGNKVYTEGDVLVGDIAEAYLHQSKVSLFSSPGRTTSILIGSSTVETLATGRGAGNYVAKLPVEVKIKKGDPIITPQIRMHTFGVVEEIMVDSSDSLQTILFKTPINIHEFRFVEVDKKAVN